MSLWRDGGSVSSRVSSPVEKLKSGLVEYTTPNLFFQSLSAIAGIFFAKIAILFVYLHFAV
jgi:hypothetical protein